MGSLARLFDAGDLCDEGGSIDMGERRRARRVVVHNAAATFGADDGEGGSAGMGATFGAAGNVDCNAIAGNRQMRGKLCCERAGRNQA